jgi:phosphate uptake regulator
MVHEINLGQRKICRVNYSLTISLPKVWAENVGVKANDFVHLSMNKDRSLIIKPKEDENEEIQ